MKSYIFDTAYSMSFNKRKTVKACELIYSDEVVSYNNLQILIPSLKSMILMPVTEHICIIPKIGGRWFIRIHEWKSVTDARKTRGAVGSWSSNSFETTAWDRKQKFEK